VGFEVEEVTVGGNEAYVKVGDALCQYDKLPEICKGLVGQATDIQMKYGVIIVVGILNVVIMGFLVWKVIQLIKLKKAKQ
jgi:hypothetical protein